MTGRWVAINNGAGHKTCGVPGLIYHRPMKLLAAVAISLFAMAHAQAESPDAGDSVALVRAMAADVTLLHASMEAMSLATREGHYTPAQLECFQKLPASAFTAGLAKVLARALTVPEISDALAFYNSPAGIKYVDYVFATLNRETGASFAVKPAGSDPMTADEMRAILAFSKSEVGEKIESGRLLLTSPESQAVAERVLGRQITACGAKIPGSTPR